MKKYLIHILPFLFCACEKKYEAPVPQTKWTDYESASPLIVTAKMRAVTEGIYAISDGSDLFGNETALKWSYIVNEQDTSFYLSGFCAKEAGYFICQAKQKDGSVLLSGYWRKQINTETGLIRLSITAEDGGKELIAGQSKSNLKITGFTGVSEGIPSKIINLVYLRPLHNQGNFQIMAHRCGGRTSDLLPASENSVNMVLNASKYGATGVEMDVRLTSDGVPIIYHDETLNSRLIQTNGMQGEISNYSYIQLYDLVRLIDGQRVPKLTEILDAIVYKTPIQIVWLDIKIHGSLQQIRDIQTTYETKAAAINRTLKIMIGIPDKDVQKNFLDLSDYKNAICVNEMLDGVESTNAYAWGPRWTLGTQDADVQKMHAEGRKAIVWTLDEAQFIKQFIDAGIFDGILSNYPALVAYYYYAKK